MDCAAQNYNNTTKAFLHCIVCSAYLHHSSFLQQLKYTGNKHHHFVEHWCTTIEQWHYSTNIDSRVCDVNYFWSALLQQNHNYFSWPEPRANVNSDTLKAVITFNRLRWLKQFWYVWKSANTFDRVPWMVHLCDVSFWANFCHKRGSVTLVSFDEKHGKHIFSFVFSLLHLHSPPCPPTEQPHRQQRQLEQVLRTSNNSFKHHQCVHCHQQHLNHYHNHHLCDLLF